MLMMTTTMLKVLTEKPTRAGIMAISHSIPACVLGTVASGRPY